MRSSTAAERRWPVLVTRPRSRQPSASFALQQRRTSPARPWWSTAGTRFARRIPREGARFQSAEWLRLRCHGQSPLDYGGLMSFLSSTRLGRASILLAGTTAAAVLLPLPAMAGGAPGTTPTITAPNDGDNVTASPVTVTATSTASKVRFIVGSKGTPVDQKTVDLVAGTASTTVDVLGATGSTVLRAADCDVAGTTCNEVSEDTVTVTVNLQNPSITSPTDHAVVGNQVPLKADAPGGRLQISVDGNTAGTPVAVPVNKNVSLTAKSQGSHTISVQQC